MKKITIIGATGTLGSAITKKLNGQGVQVKAVVRDLEKAKQMLPAEVELVQGDVSDKDSLRKALIGTQTIYLNLNTISWDVDAPFHPEREGIINVVDVAKELGVKHIMQIVGIDSSNPEFATKGMIYKTNLIRKPAMDYLKASRINYTFFHCSVFLDSFPTFIDNGEFAIIGNHKHSIFFTNTSDLAHHIERAIDNEKAFNQHFTVQGNEGLSFPEAAQRFVKAYNPEIKVSEYPLETVHHLGLPDEEADFMEHMLTYTEQLKEEQVSEPTWEKLGTPSMTIESFVETLKN
jgi:uncharacterized protein YbjT (DUF2867 family)